MKLIISLFSDITSLIVKFWMLGIQLLVMWLIIALFVPGISWFDHTYSIITYLFIYPASFVFDLFIGYKEVLLAGDMGGSNPLANFVHLLLFLGCIALSLALPVVYWFSWALMSFIVLTSNIKIAPVGEGITSPEMKNNLHLLNGRTSIDELYAADVQANAIASALKK